MIAMAIGTIQCPVHSFQRISDCRGVIPFVRRYILPGIWSVAIAAVSSQSQLISIILAPFPMAGFAFSGSSFENQTQMAVPTGRGPVFSDEGKIGVVVGLDEILGSFLTG
jgi:hypothetical protein